MAMGYTGLQSVINPSIEQGEGHVTRLGPHNFYVAVGDWGAYANTSIPNYTSVYNQTNAQNDKIYYSFWLSLGTYTFVHYGITASNYAIGTYYLDDVSIGTLDWYSAGTVYGVRQTIASLAVTTAGQHSLAVSIESRHGSSTGWYVLIISLCMYRTA